MDPRPKYMSRPNTMRAVERLEREMKHVIAKQRGMEWERELARERLAATLDYILAIGCATRPEHPSQGPKEGPTNVTHIERPRA